MEFFGISRYNTCRSFGNEENTDDVQSNGNKRIKKEIDLNNMPKYMQDFCNNKLQKEEENLKEKTPKGI